MFKQLSIVLLTLLPTLGFSAEAVEKAQTKNLSSVKTVNKLVEDLERRITQGDRNLPILKVEYDFPNPSEGVPPSFKFYFETKDSGTFQKSTLRVCKIHIGHEVFSKEYSYYFDERGAPLKFLVINSGLSGDGGFPASRDGIIYDKAGKSIWTSGPIEPPQTFNQLKELFILLDKSLNKF